MKRPTALFVLAAAIALGACASGPGQLCSRCPGGKTGVLASESQPSAAIYSCACGPGCGCGAVSTKPGACGCGKPLAGGHVIFTEGNTALVCACDPVCPCKIDPNDRSRCGCNKPLKRINLEGTGIYFCNCGGSCACNALSDQPGACRCGMPLHRAP